MADVMIANAARASLAVPAAKNLSSVAVRVMVQPASGVAARNMAASNRTFSSIWVAILR